MTAQARRALPALLLLLTYAAPGLAVQQILSEDEKATYNCPTQEAIEFTYYDSCPSSSLDGERSVLLAVGSEGFYKTPPPSDGRLRSSSYELSCTYGASSTDTSRINCAYTSTDGGVPQLDPDYPIDNYDPSLCRSSAQTDLSPSGGFRKRREAAELSKRAISSPSAVCPWTYTNATDDTTVYSLIDAYTNGGENANDGTGNNYYCVYTSSGGNFYCGYNGPGEAAFAFDNADYCPKVLCDPVSTRTQDVTKRRIGGDTPAIAARQVKTKQLREKLRRKL